MTDSCYDHPDYYEIAFSFRDIAAEVDVIRQTVERFGAREVRRVLQLACGPSQHMAALCEAGFAYVGLDISRAMLAHAAARARALGLTVELHAADMVDFKLAQPVDYAFIALGDLYAGSTAELRSLLRSVAAALQPGGLFLLDWCVQFEPEKFFDPAGQAWSISRDAVQVDARVEMKPLDRAEQTFTETLILDIHDGDRALRLESAALKRAVFPQEFLLLIDALGDFEFVGWWNNWDLSQPIASGTAGIFRPITLLRRKPRQA